MTTILSKALLRPSSSSSALGSLLLQRTAARFSSSFTHLELDRPSPGVVHVRLNRPNKRNALNNKIWREIGACFDDLSEDEECRSIVISGNGKSFCAGIDLTDFMSLIQFDDDVDIARRNRIVYRGIKDLQDWFTALEKCRKPVIAAIHGFCIGGGIDLATAADVRLCSKDAVFNVKEVTMGLAADVGTLQRLPRVVGNQSFVREICLTARDFDAEEARREGLVSGKIYEDHDSLIEGALSMAATMASKSPLAIQGTKYYLVRTTNGKDVDDELENMARWNGTMLQSEDLTTSAMAALTKQEEPPEFKNY